MRPLFRLGEACCGSSCRLVRSASVTSRGEASFPRCSLSLEIGSSPLVGNGVFMMPNDPFAPRKCERLPSLSRQTRKVYLLAVELRHLRYFVAVAEMENVSRAAVEKLHVAQPSLSRQIRNLEDELGVQLFERTGKKVNLTDAGRLFLREARTLLQHTDDIVSKVRA